MRTWTPLLDAKELIGKFNLTVAISLHIDGSRTSPNIKGLIKSPNSDCVWVLVEGYSRPWKFKFEEGRLVKTDKLVSGLQKHLYKYEIIATLESDNSH